MIAVTVAMVAAVARVVGGGAWNRVSELPTRILMLLKLVLCMYADIGELFVASKQQRRNK